MVFENSNSIKIIHYNCDGITTFSHLVQFENLLEREKIHIASLSETHLNENHKTYFKNYLIYRNVRQNSRGEGVALVIRRSVQHKLLPLLNTRRVENLSIEIMLNNRPVIIFISYSSKYVTSFAYDFIKLTSFNKDFIILGNFKAKHSSWYCNNNNSAGNVLYNIQQTYDFFVYH